MKINIDTLCKCFSYVASQRSLQPLYEMLDPLIEALMVFTVRQCNFVEGQAGKSKDQTPKQHYLGMKNYLVAYCCPIYFSRIDPGKIYSKVHPISCFSHPISL